MAEGRARELLAGEEVAGRKFLAEQRDTKTDRE